MFSPVLDLALTILAMVLFWKYIGRPFEDRLRSFRGFRILPPDDDET